MPCLADILKYFIHGKAMLTPILCLFISDSTTMITTLLRNLRNASGMIREGGNIMEDPP